MNVGNLAAEQMNALQSYVKGGGGLLLAPADRAGVAAFNRDYQELTPALLQRKHIFSEGRRWLLPRFKGTIPLFVHWITANQQISVQPVFMDTGALSPSPTAR